MNKFKVGDIIKIVKLLPQDIALNIQIKDRGIIKEIDTMDEKRYIVKMDKLSHTTPMIESQMEFSSDPMPDYPQLREVPFVIHSDISNSITQKEEKNMKILEIYRNKYFEKIRNEYEEKGKKIKSEDPIQMVLNDTLNHIKEILEIEEDYSQEKIYFIEDKLKINNYTSDTERLLNEIGKEKNEKIKELNNLLEEITAMLSMTDNYEEQIKILKNYGIIDKKTNKLSI